jgi:NIPSNAP
VNCCAIVELRQYTLHPGKRDILIDLFDREFIETQEAVGMRIIGQFRDLDNPDRFVWLRGFPDMARRAQALQAFYSGSVWKKHRDTANATMIDSDNVLLLRPARANSGFELGSSVRPARGASNAPKGLVVATIYYFNAPVGVTFVDFFERDLKPALTETGAPILAYFVTENSANNFPALPVREGEHVFVWFSCFPNGMKYEEFAATFAQQASLAGELNSYLKGSPEVLKVSPTARSRLRDIQPRP